MKVVVSAIGRFHSFNQARQLQDREALQAIFTGYPRFKLRGCGVEPDRIHTYPWLQTPYMALSRYPWFQRRFDRDWSWLAQQAHDRHVARNLPPCDVLIALSGMGLASGRRVQARGGRYVCDRGSSHKVFQNDILHEEYARHGFVFPGVDPRSIDREVEEYAQADAIAVPSAFVRRSFLEKGVPEEKLIYAPYGGDITRFRPLAPKSAKFRVLFVGALSLQKGLPDLLAGFSRAAIPGAELVLVGGEQPETRIILERAQVTGVEIAGMRRGEDLAREMSRAHVLVLPSIQDGFGMVMAEAMACGAPVIASHNTGAGDLFDDGVEGFLVPIRDPDAIADRLDRLAANPSLRAAMGEAARRRMEGFGGWNAYGDRLFRALERLNAGKNGG